MRFANLCETAPGGSHRLCCYFSFLRGLIRLLSHIAHFFLEYQPCKQTIVFVASIIREYFNQHRPRASSMEPGDTATPSPKSKENNPLEPSRFAHKAKATTAIDNEHGVTHEASSPVRQSQASGSSHGKHVLSHAIKSLIPHSSRSASGNKSKKNPRSPLPQTFQAKITGTTPAVASMSDDQLMEAHVFHSRQAIAYLDELVRRRKPAPPAWKPPNDWNVSNALEGPPATDAEQPRLRDVGSLASVDEEPTLTNSPQEIRKDSAFTQSVRRSIASAGEGPSFEVGRGLRPARLAAARVTAYCDDANVRVLNRNSQDRARVQVIPRPGRPRGRIVCVSKKQRGVILTRKTNTRVRDSFMLKNVMRTPCTTSQDDSAEWLSEDDSELVKMPGQSISIVKIKTHLEAEMNLLHLSLRTAIPMQYESSKIHARGSSETSQLNPHLEACAGPSTNLHEPGESTKSSEASRSSEAEHKPQDQGSAREARDVAFTSVGSQDR